MILGILQARTSSSRLPNKVLKELLGASPQQRWAMGEAGRARVVTEFHSVTEAGKLARLIVGAAGGRS